MSKTIPLVLGVIAVINVIYSFFGDSKYESIFGIEMNIWLYRLIWSILAIGLFNSYANKRKAK